MSTCLPTPSCKHVASIAFKYVSYTDPPPICCDSHKLHLLYINIYMWLPRYFSGKESACQCLEDSMDRGAWQATVNEVTKYWTQLSN